MEQLPVEQKALLETTRKYLQGVAQEQEIHTVEGEIFRMTQRLGRVFMKEFLALAGTGHVAGSCQTPAGQSLPLQDVKSCQYLSVFGRLEIPRAYYWDEGAAGYYPLDARRSSSYLGFDGREKNGPWNEFWNYHVTQERQRLYGRISA